MRIALALLALLVAGCGPEPPYIRMLQYSPNAAFVGEKQTINGSFLYSDPDRDVSQWVVELIDDKNNLLLRSPPTPVQSIAPGPTGAVSFTIEFIAPSTGIFQFQLWLIDLLGLESNKLSGLIRVASKTP